MASKLKERHCIISLWLYAVLNTCGAIIMRRMVAVHMGFGLDRQVVSSDTELQPHPTLLPPPRNTRNPKQTPNPP